MREVGELIAEVRETLREMIAPGITTLELNAIAEKMMRQAGAIPTFIGYRPHGMVPFPFAICASVNEAVVHGFSNKIPLQEGDIISLDMAATYNGFVGDTAFTAPVGKIDDDVAQLIKVTEECLYAGIEQCHPNKKVGDIGFAVQNHAVLPVFRPVRRIGRRLDSFAALAHGRILDGGNREAEVFLSPS